MEFSDAHGPGTSPEINREAEKQTPLQKSSCDQCRRRKIRCDRVDPCCHCAYRKIQCTYPAGYKPRAKRQRNLPLTERQNIKLDEISCKLDQISLAVENIGSTRTTSSPSGNDLNSLLIRRSPFASHTSSTVAIHPTDTSPAGSTEPSESFSEHDLDDDAPLAEQATFATNYLELAVDNHLSSIPPEVKESIDALKRALVGKVDLSSTPSSSPLCATVSHVESQLPSIQLGMLAIHKFRDTPSLELLSLIAFHDIGQFVDYFLSAYSGKPTATDLVIVYCGLSDLFLHCGYTETNPTMKKEFLSAHLLCRSNLEAILASLPFNLPCTVDTALSLIMAACSYLEECRMSVAWNYLAAAAQMCFRLGLHTDTPNGSMSQETQRAGTKVFWLTYMLDKALSLRLNRPYCINDKYISARLDRLEGLDMGRIHPIVPKWIKQSIVHGKVYDEIYSAKALREPQVVRQSRARSLANELQNVFDSKDPLEEQFLGAMRHRLGESMQKTYQIADSVSHLSCLTLIYRSIQPSSSTYSVFSNECLTAAKQSLEQQRACLELLKLSSPSVLDIYAQWALLAWPFVPFIVVFCNAIETCDPARLNDLLSVIETLKIMENILPEAYKKQLRLFKLMHDVAIKYIGSRSNTKLSQALGQFPRRPFDLFFSQANTFLPSHEAHLQPVENIGQTYMTQGQIPQSADVDSTTSRVEGDQGEFDYGSQLGEWFTQNFQVFQMLEKDFSGPS